MDGLSSKVARKSTSQKPKNSLWRCFSAVLRFFSAKLLSTPPFAPNFSSHEINLEAQQPEPSPETNMGEGSGNKYKVAFWATLAIFALFVVYVQWSTPVLSASVAASAVTAGTHASSKKDPKAKFVIPGFNVEEKCPQLKDDPKRPFRVAKTITKPKFLISMHPKGELISDSIAQRGSWEYVKNALLFKSVMKHANSTVVNAGANIGALALYFAALGFETHAFEPEPTNFKLLTCSASLNNFIDTKRLIPYNMAVGDDSKGRVCMVPVESNMGGTTAKSAEGDSCPHSVPVAVLDEFVSAHPQSFSVGSFALLLIDVEGYEPLLFRGFQKTLANAALRPRLIDMELSCNRWKEKGFPNCMEVLDMVTRHGYKVIGPAGAVKNLAKWVKDNYELSTNLVLSLQ